jgi:hypothetical protein
VQTTTYMCDLEECRCVWNDTGSIISVVEYRAVTLHFCDSAHLARFYAHRRAA